MGKKTSTRKKNPATVKRVGSGNAPGFKKNSLTHAVNREICKNDQRNTSMVDNFSTIWDDVSSIYQTIGDALITVLDGFRDIFTNKEILDNIEDKKQLSTYIDTLNSDAETLSIRLLEVYNQHKDKTGGPKDEYELQAALVIFEKYNEINTYFHTTVTATTGALHDMIIEAQFKIDQKLADDKNNIEEGIFEDVVENTIEGKAE